jgi:hypothetical protein
LRLGEGRVKAIAEGTCANLVIRGLNRANAIIAHHGEVVSIFPSDWKFNSLFTTRLATSVGILAHNSESMTVLLANVTCPLEAVFAMGLALDRALRDIVVYGGDPAFAESEKTLATIEGFLVQNARHFNVVGRNTLGMGDRALDIAIERKSGEVFIPNLTSVPEFP